jgi:hypothetical protein
MDKTSDAFGVFSPPGSKTHPQFINFVDSEHRELFKIPDGANIRIIYPPGDGRGIITAPCRYIDNHHLLVNNTSYHIDEFADRMERIGARYEPEIRLRDTEVLPFAPGEEKYLTYNREEGNTCVGHIAGDFGNNGDRFRSDWKNHTTKSNGDWANTAPEFREELFGAVYALRQGPLKDRDAMIAFCKDSPKAKLQAGDNYEIYGFKMETVGRRYFIHCFLGEYRRDASFIIYAYDKVAPARGLEQPDEVDGTRLSVIEILPGVDESEMFYRNDAENSRCVGYMRGDFGKTGGEFWHSWVDGGGAYGNTPEFEDEFKDVVKMLRREVLKDYKSSSAYCREHPEARLPGGGGYHYGFKAETKDRLYFVRCTTLRDDYFYVFAYDKAAPACDRDRPADKSSVLKQIREPQKTPKPPRKEKTAGKKKEAFEL